LIGRVTFSLTTAGTWDETGDQLDIAPIETTKAILALYETDTARSITNAAFTAGEFICEDKIFDTHKAYNTSTAVFTCPMDGKYEVKGMCRMGSHPWVTDEALKMGVFKNGTPAERVFGSWTAPVTTTVIAFASGSIIVDCIATDTLEVVIFQNTGSAFSTVAGAESEHWVSYRRISD
jgi:hypothetical protein